MFKSLSRFMLGVKVATGAFIVGAVVAASISASATVGIPPNPANGPSLVDGTWLNGLAGGLNNSYQYGLTGAGTNQATATQFPSGYELLEADTVAGSTGFALPFAYQGTEIYFYNNGANTATIYPNVTNNPSLSPAAQDTINNGTSITVASHTGELFFCAKNGVWFAK